ncbi:tRNA uridine-5-carboxymethylaminomethyl(34) synthesis enzyme MnmG [Sporosarcina pasteurii]|uniref:tRNA uridine 5-carboxymethylaminomethyl modification enzyme MnmG n=1 Tax=Sporosarcina pasteurii TaxID=1474 RepID=A0A380CJX9_SPOPA|nr:tRNA uridine-5-carboxymethylaminomethyl(34) synthesis enzyme MnmG [Sporosarcina pasteurii]MDS9471835.1 tRNA uridine-5-carboxymethylaminomethyl(34) synthesis enzyme MnmG [Sporosarcina pasteurii]QBQ06574.1 tRNA uridine-5-carboxymethylaminomethyl(34) synthesis enzyme MnmG [Sporosarcina pasteurii]SUJ22029.1 Glucose-inhibited division protein A [Sporosarcina pasteurii]
MPNKFEAGTFDCIVIGAGHAGVEAALASARMGASTLVLTLNIDMIAFMPCNPSIGGPAKGIVVREIDALGGAMGKVIDKTHIQMRMLNTRKGPAVRALRAQLDKVLYQQEMKRILEETENLTLQQASVDELIVEDGEVKGVITQVGAVYRAKTVIVTTGTFLRGEILIGDLRYSSGPNNQMPSIKLADNLRELGFEMVRFKTGTPPRINSRTIDYSQTEIQPGDEEPRAFSYETTEFIMDQLPCWLTYTSPLTHEIINENLRLSPMYSGEEVGPGPRYCPSIEDKIVRFNDKSRHQIFLEPEGRNTEEVYVQGLSTSLPEHIQHRLIASVPGLEKAKMMRAGYAIEYDAIIPTQLKPTLETKKIRGLYTAGQLNGTSGYEEAAGQGLLAGANAAARALGKEEFILARSDGYMGVLIDDLVTKGTSEPYRLLTSRAEYRLLLRHDNADLRLTELGYEVGLVSEERYQKYVEKKQQIDDELKRLRDLTVKPSEFVNEVLAETESTALKEPMKAAHILKRPEVTYDQVARMIQSDVELSPEVIEQVEIFTKYEGYIEKSMQQVERMKKMEDKKIPHDIDYDAITGIANEAKAELNKVRPLSIAQASRMPGVNPADVSILLVYIEQGKIAKVSS